MPESRPIAVLPPSLANRIAAGEVVERPASVVKELVENALDAGARRIEVAIDRGGQGRILVADDGSGMDRDQIPLALTRHATSKIATDADLFTISTMGFRGEALPSIASVARVSVASRLRGAEEGWRLVVEAGEDRGLEPVSMAPGTKVEVRDLFANVPARLKFLKAESTEAKRCRETVMRLALAAVDTAFVLHVNGKEIYNLPPGQDLADRLAAFWPPALCRTLAPVDYEAGEVRVRGLVAPPNQAQARGDKVLFFVNNRAVRDKLLLSAARKAFEGRMLSREHPALALFLDMPVSMVDVNVHPAKHEVRFSQESLVFTTVRAAVLRALEAAGAEADVATGAGYEPSKFPARAPLSAWREQEKAATRLHLDPGPPDPRPLSPEPPRMAEAGAPAWERQPAPPPLRTPAPQGPDTDVPCLESAGLTYLGQIANTYLVLKDRAGRLVVLDQHAAHERVLFEAMRPGADKDGVQPLAVPLDLPLHPSESERLQGLWAELRQLGFDVSQPSPDTARIRAVPGGLSPGEAREYLAKAVSGKAGDLKDLKVMLACKSALKAGTALAPAEALGLVSAWLACPDKDYCPHGRPVSAVLGENELARLFKRGR